MGIILIAVYSFFNCSNRCSLEKYSKELIIVNEMKIYFQIRICAKDLYSETIITKESNLIRLYDFSNEKIYRQMQHVGCFK